MTKNTDMKLFAKCVCLADYYPESLGTVFIVGANWLFQSLWAVAVKLIDPVTVKKVNMLSSNDTEAIKELQKVIGDSNLIPMLGGDPKKLKKGHLPASTPDSYVYGDEKLLEEQLSNADVEKIVHEVEKDLTPIIDAQPERHFSAEELNLD